MQDCVANSQRKNNQIQGITKPKSDSGYDFKENDLALLNIENVQKLDSLCKGPCEIKKILSSNAVIQELGKRSHQEVHISRLKLYFSSLSGVENAAT